MSTVAAALSDLGSVDDLARRDSPVHRLDPRAKVVTTVVFVVAVVSFGRYEISALMPFLLYPVALAAAARVPASFLLRKLILVSPFVLLIAAFNPLLDRAPMVEIGPAVLSGGWVSFLSIVLKAALTLSAAMLLLATTGLTAVASALDRMGTPRPFVVQLLLLYRYLFVLGEEAVRLTQARALRSFGRRGLGIRTHGALLGHLLLRTLARAERLHRAMLSRGFDGRVHLRRQLSLGADDVLFAVGWIALFALMRSVNLARLLGATALAPLGLS
jgi:cobalt/nickel transport system permease protein